MIERFMSKFIPVPESGCWLWEAFCNAHGYGQFHVGKKDALAHRVSFELFRGPITEGLDVCHHCDVPCCVNPNHLFLGTALDNVHDAKRKGRLRGQFALQESCIHGHVAWRCRGGRRYCTACVNENARKRRAAKRTGQVS